MHQGVKDTISRVLGVHNPLLVVFLVGFIASVIAHYETPSGIPRCF